MPTPDLQRLTNCLVETSPRTAVVDLTEEIKKERMKESTDVGTMEQNESGNSASLTQKREQILPSLDDMNLFANIKGEER